MEHSLFRLVRKTGTYADALAALGLAEILYQLTGREVRIRDDGAYYAVEPKLPVRLEDLHAEILRANPGYPYVKIEAEDPDAPNKVIDYQKERQRLLAYREMKKKGLVLDQEQAQGIEPHDWWYLIQNLNVLQAFNSYNGLHAAIRRAEAGEFRESLITKLAALAEHGDAALVETPFSPKVSPLQAFNPAIGKGVNRPKPDGAAVASLPAAFVDWFEEWLRYVGIHITGNAFNIGDDIKLVTLAPADLEITFLRQSIGPAFRQLRLAWASIQIDVLGALGVAETLIKGSGMLEGGMRGFLFGRTPRQVVAGLQTAYFASLGSARALNNTSFIGLPGWFPVDSREDAEAWLEIIGEHRACLRPLDEEKSEEAALLHRYRNFLSGNSLGDLLDFLAAYGAYLIRNREQGRPVPQFTTSNMRRLMERMERKLTPILENAGFRNVATAIRRATVIEQYMKAKRQDVFEIHYGLVPDLRRKARFRDQFVEALCDFVDRYNRENARRAEQLKDRPGRRRDSVTTGDIQEVIRLVDEHGPQLVAMLLIAYGTAKEPKEAEIEAQAAGV